MDAGRGLLRDTLHVLTDARPLPRVRGERRANQVDDDAPLFRVVLGIEGGDAVRRRELDAFVDEERRVAAVIDK